MPQNSLYIRKHGDYMQQSDTFDKINVTDNPAASNGRQEENSNGDYIFDLLNNIMSAKPQDTVTDSSNETNTQTKQSSKASTGNSDILTSLLSNPDLLSKLPQLISVIGPLMSSLSSQTATNTSPPRENEAKPVAAIPSISVSKKNESDHRAALLCAMKPYLSPERQNAIDYIIKLGKLGEILKTL